ncbi:MAG: DUF2892 domain-containing protein [Pusillimonas sp.]|nr:DUF2892 domain-containing protein [Pusillimonas sp.]
MKNVGGADRAVRIIVGLALIIAALADYIGPWGWIGIIPLATGLIGMCPIYRLFGFSSCPLKSK